MIYSFFQRIGRLTALTLALVAGAGHAGADTYHYGYAPAVCNQQDLFAQGTGMNNHVSGAICLDPASDPIFARLVGGKILGVRCYLLNDYKQKSKGHSYGFLYEGSLDATPIKQIQNLETGWNDILFETPVEIKSQPYYVGFNVFELKSVAMPLLSYKHVSLPSSCFVNLSKEGWQSFDDRGTLFIEAIVEAPAGVLDNTAIAYPGKMPIIVAPATEFEAPVYVKNMSANPLSAITLESATEESSFKWEHRFSAPLESNDGCMLSSTLMAPSTTSAASPLTVRIVETNGAQCPAVYSSSVSLYVSKDVFTRIPLIEEFTSTFCINCPFMMYYMERAIEQYGKPVVYLTRHSGFAKDRLTTPSDEEILYLFGSSNTFNPAAMFDRRVLQGETNPIMSARDASIVPYLARIENAMQYPALAKVDVSLSYDSEGKAVVNSTGKINSELARSGADFYIASYIVEDSIPANDYPQQGIINPMDDAPEDLVPTFRHNGTIRAVLQSEPIGDKLQYDSEGNFSVSYPAAALADRVNRTHCHAVSMVFRVNREDLRDNEVLNCGSSRFNSESGLNSITDFKDGFNCEVRNRRLILCGAECQSATLYDMRGRTVNIDSELSNGLYLIRYTLANGRTGSRKIVVK